MTWTQEETEEAAKQELALSGLLKRDRFKHESLRWLTKSHVERFLKTVDIAEAAELRREARRWTWTAESGTSGFPLLDWLWVVGPESDWKRKDLSAHSGSAGAGRQIVVRLAAHEPEWVATWWQWRIKHGRGQSDHALVAAFANALTPIEFAQHSSKMADDCAASIVRVNPSLYPALSIERRGAVLAGALRNNASDVDKLIRSLSDSGVPANVRAVVDGIFTNAPASDIEYQLDQLARFWQGPVGSDPISRTLSDGHPRLDVLLRSRWHPAREAPNRRNEKDPWALGPGPSSSVGDAFAAAARSEPARFRLELGFTIGRHVGEDRGEASPETVRGQLQKLAIDSNADDVLVDAVLPMARLWANLRTLSTYQAAAWQHNVELVGLRARIAAIAAEDPGIWAQALPWILQRAPAFGDLSDAVTLELAATVPVVRSALEAAGADEDETIRLRARGLWALLHGIEDPGAGLSRTLADAAARHLDGVPVFPHPLAPLSATWLTSSGVERALADGIRRAVDRFSDDVRDQGGDVEEALTRALLKEIEFEFRQIRPRLALMARSAPASLPLLSVRQRPVSKTTEEPVYGCDLAFLLDASVPSRYRATWADIVQVKKSVALQGRRAEKATTDSWRINIEQLELVMTWSSTASYWLIAAAGEVLAIPARHLAAIRDGARTIRRGATFNVGYHEVRSAAIPLEQYLVDLLIGQWIGSSAENLLRFVRGEDTRIRPRIVVEVTVSLGHSDQGETRQ